MVDEHKAAYGDMVSVLVPAYNAEKYLKETLMSISAQTYRNIEIIVVNDGSLDRTRSILEEYQLIDKRLVVLTQENSGISAALNAGLSKARGLLVARIDADDIMLPDRIKTQVDFMSENLNLGFCASSIELIDDRGRQSGSFIPYVRSLEQLDHVIRWKGQFSFTHPSVMFRRDVVWALGGYNAEFEPCEDQHLFLRMIDAGYPGFAQEQVLTRYRLHRQSISVSNALKQIRMTNFIYHNFYRAREGQAPISFSTFLTRGIWLSRALDRWNEWADLLKVRGRYLIINGFFVTGKAVLVLSFTMRSVRFLQRVSGRLM